MTESTTRAQFDALIDGHRVVPVVRRLFADTETPVGLYRKLANDRPGSFLLESAEQGGIWSRYSFIGVSSFGVLSQIDGSACWIDYGLSEERAFGGSAPDGPLDAVAALYHRWRTPAVPGHPPLTGGLVGFVGWEAIRQLERLPEAKPADYDVPGQALSFVDELVVIDHRTGAVLLIATCLADGVDTPDVMWARAIDRLDRLQHLMSVHSEAWIGTADFSVTPAPTARVRPEDFRAAVETAKEHIRIGDVFQVVVSQRFDLELTASPLDVYRVLRTVNPSPYMYLLSLESPNREPYWVVGSSPEALVKVEQDRVLTHPIAGSKPRGATPEQDIALADELTSDPKERAEHLMLVDLARNDLLRVCVPGTVEVSEFMRVERFSHIMHLVSTVEGTLRPDADSIDVFRATFPAGTLSGAPKPRALEIITDLEPAQRGIYGGVVGYFGFAGDADLAIAIRTATLMGGMAHVQAGGGLVADSVPESEYQESRNKAAAPLRAVAIANSLVRLETG